jgi:integrase
LLDQYLDDTRTQKRRWRSDRGIVEGYLRPRWGDRKAASIIRIELRELRREITKADNATRANRVLASASAIFSFAVEAELIENNPTRGIKRNREAKRTRYLSQDELRRLGRVLRDWPDQVAATAIRLLLLTSCRRGKLLGALWGEFDLVAGAWTKPASRTKAKREHRLPRPPEAIAELQHCRGTITLIFCFPIQPIIDTGSKSATGRRSARPWASATCGCTISATLRRVCSFRRVFAAGYRRSIGTDGGRRHQQNRAAHSAAHRPSTARADADLSPQPGRGAYRETAFAGFRLPL